MKPTLTSNLHGLPISLTNRCTVFTCLVQPHLLPSSTRYVHSSRKNQLYTYLGSTRNLVLLSLLTECDEVCTQFQENPAIHLQRLQKHAFAFLCIVILHTIIGKNHDTLTKAGLCVFTYCDSAHNSKKNQPYTYLTYDSRPVHFHVL